MFKSVVISGGVHYDKHVFKKYEVNAALCKLTLTLMHRRKKIGISVTVPARKSRQFSPLCLTLLGYIAYMCGTVVSAKN